MNWNELAEYRIHVQALVLVVLNVRVPITVAARSKV
jgi:hypothetical protein